MECFYARWAGMSVVNVESGYGACVIVGCCQPSPALQVIHMAIKLYLSHTMHTQEPAEAHVTSQPD